MHSFKITTALFAALSAATNIVTFQSLDDIDRVVYTTPSSGVEGVDPVTVKGGESVDIELAEGFIGNSYAIHDGDDNVPGMLAEFTFQGYGGATYFDVSAIVDATDNKNVKEIYPYEEPHSPVSGCSVFPCDTAYYHPDDIQTLSTDQTHLIVTLGSNNAAASKRSPTQDAKLYPRNLVIEKY